MGKDTIDGRYIRMLVHYNDGVIVIENSENVRCKSSEYVG